jgi:signal transduction histidine kinase
VTIARHDAAEIAHGVIESARLHLPENVELALAPAPELPPIAADADKVRQVLANLVDNGVKYSPDGGTVSIEVGAVDGRIRYAVRDEGLGIPPAEHRRIFEKFYRLDPNLTRGVGGTGLGLYVCRELARMMGGRIWVESTGERGSTFNFELPVADAHGAAEAAPR